MTSSNRVFLIICIPIFLPTPVSLTLAWLYSTSFELSNLRSICTTDGCVMSDNFAIELILTSSPFSSMCQIALRYISVCSDSAVPVKSSSEFLSMLLPLIFANWTGTLLLAPVGGIRAKNLQTIVAIIPLK